MIFAFSEIRLVLTACNFLLHCMHVKIVSADKGLDAFNWRIFS